MSGEEEFGRGAQAIDEALKALYGDHARCFVGSPSPLPGVRAFRSNFGGRPHWHFVTYGLSELLECDPADNDGFSSYGFELTARVADDGDTAPIWVLPVLGGLAQYVFNTGNVFEAGHHIANNGPIHRERPTELSAFGFVDDPELPTIETPNGRVSFIQVIGLTADERGVCRAWNGPDLFAFAKEIDPALLTDLGRKSWLTRPEVRQRVPRECVAD